MDCQAVYELMNRYLDAEISLEEERVLEFHLERCHHCQKLFGELKDLHIQLNSLEPSHDFTANVMGKIYHTKALPSRWFGNLRQKQKRVAVAILFLVFGSFFLQSIVRPTPEVIISEGHIQTGISATGERELIVKEGKIKITGLSGTVQAINSQIVFQKTSADLYSGFFSQVKEKIYQLYQQIKVWFQQTF